MNYSAPTRSKYKVGGKVGGKAARQHAKKTIQECKKGTKCAGKNTADKFGKGMSTIKKKRPKPGKKTPVVKTPVSSASHVNPRFMKSPSPENTAIVRAKADGMKNSEKVYKKAQAAKNNIDKSKVNAQSNVKSKVGSIKKKKDEFNTVTRPTASSVMKKGGKTPKSKAAAKKKRANISMLQGYKYKNLSPMEIKKLKLKEAKDVKMIKQKKKS
tara:strand:+ start:1834 stop:2472 length:639 start_codon:yes stop_codon:yes gene_type:complete